MWHMAWALLVVWLKESAAKHSGQLGMMAGVLCARPGRWDAERSGTLHQPWGHVRPLASSAGR